MLELNRVYCGDALELMRGLPDNSVDLCLTDPPYGIGEANGKNKSRGCLATAKDFGCLDWDNSIPGRNYFEEMLRVSKNQIIFGGNYFIEYLHNSPCWIVWDKDNGDTDFADCELAWTSFTSAVRRFKWRWQGMLQQDMRNKETRVHPTQKPVKLGVWILKNYSQPGDVILDCFCGSGSFLVAAAQTGHPWIGIDISPTYCKLAEERIKHETRQTNMFHRQGGTQ
jgi:site-specific DNA-methyltransferase (adenine-specific)